MIQLYCNCINAKKNIKKIAEMCKNEKKKQRKNISKRIFFRGQCGQMVDLKAVMPYY